MHRNISDGGEKELFHEGSTCQGRENSNHKWYDLTYETRPHLIFPKIQQYRHIIADNHKAFPCNSNLLGLYVSELNPKVLCAVLNSTIVAMTKQFFARIHGREGSLQLDVYSAAMMLVPDPRNVSVHCRARLLKALGEMKGRQSQNLVEEFSLPDRQELDDAVLEMIGIKEKRERVALRERLYEAMTVLYREIREVELQVQKNRLAQARRGRTTPRSLAEEIWGQYDKSKIMSFPEVFIPKDTPCETIELPAGPGKVLNDLFTPPSLKVGSVIIPLQDVERVHFAKAALDAGRSGPVSIPHDSVICKNILSRYEAYLAERDKEFSVLAGEYTSDETMHAKIIRELFRLCNKTL